MSYDGVSPGAGRRSSRRTSSVAPEGGDEDPQAVVVRNLWRRRYLLPPYQSRWSARRRYWGLVLLACSFYESFAIPFQLAFYHSAAGVPPTLPQLLVGYAIDLAFWVEILLTFRTCIETSLEEGSEIVSDTALIARRYLRGTFALDLLGVLPIEIFALASRFRMLEKPLRRTSWYLSVCEMAALGLPRENLQSHPRRLRR